MKVILSFCLLGTTPQRRDFEYPRVLSKTAPHDKIVEEFRKNYLEQEAVDTAVPYDSDTDDDLVCPQYIITSNFLSVILSSIDRPRIFNIRLSTAEDQYQLPVVMQLRANPCCELTPYT